MSNYLGWLVSYMDNGERVFGHLVCLDTYITGSIRKVFGTVFDENSGKIKLIEVTDPGIDFQVEGRTRRPLNA